MQESGLKHFERKQSQRNGQTTWRLFWRGGPEYTPFAAFCNSVGEFKFNTRRTYAMAVSRFLDFLAEAGVLRDGTTAFALLRAIDAYSYFLLTGAAELIRRHEVCEATGSPSEDAWLIAVARGLNWRPLGPESVKVARAAVNRFLKLSELSGRVERERCEAASGATQSRSPSIVQSHTQTAVVSALEVAAMKRNSVFGSVAKFNSQEVRRAPGIRMPRTAPRQEFDPEFPLCHLRAVLDCARNWRDRLLWLVLVTLGVRVSEALNLLLEHIDFTRQRVFIIAPTGPRFLEDLEHIGFKGRTGARTLPIPGLKDLMFDALQKYLTTEYVPALEPGKPAYLFQYIDSEMRGQPLLRASHAALCRQFSRAQQRAAIGRPSHRPYWNLHSLRHAYGVYMKNDLPVDPANGRYGLSLTELQMLMGHKKLEHTSRYARSKFGRLQQKFEDADERVLSDVFGSEPWTLKPLQSNLRIA